MEKFTEDKYRDAISTLFVEQDYDCFMDSELCRSEKSEPLLKEDLLEFLSSRYSDLTENEKNEIVNKLRNIPCYPLYEGNRETFWRVNEGFDLRREDKSKKNIHIDYIDFESPKKNTFKVVCEYTVLYQGQERRADLMIFVNGIPVAIWEVKSAIREDAKIANAWAQIHNRYTRDMPNLLKYCFISVISDGPNTCMGSVFAPYEHYRAWNEASLRSERQLRSMIKGVFAKERLVSILRDFIFYPDATNTGKRGEDDDDKNEEEAVVCRHQQFSCANKMFDSIRGSVLSNGERGGKGGTYFGATGCGKTYAMLFLSRLIIHRDNDAFCNPTILVIVDREELNSQTAGIFVSAKKFLGCGDVCSLTALGNIDPKSKENEGRATLVSGGVYITTIQKFREETGLLSERRNIICISDEAHRSQTNVGTTIVTKDEKTFPAYGFAEYLRRSFPNATYCGFSGTVTPDAIEVFGPPVDKYTMKDAVDDGVTVGITYEPRLARICTSREEVEQIDQLYIQYEKAGASKEHIIASQRAMSRMRAILAHPERVRKIAGDIVEHYELMCSQKPEVVQKAMIVCVDRETAFAMLKAIIEIKPGWGKAQKAENEKSLPKKKLNALVALPKINLVATQGVDDPRELFNACGDDKHRKMLEKQFKKVESNFKIAIVVDMWNTGFDVPSLAVMYIDKPLKKHTLVQTISRVNRVFKGKDKGLVVDYIGFQKEMEEALRLYGGEGESPVESIDVVSGVFRDTLGQLDVFFKDFDASNYFDGSALEQSDCIGDAAEFSKKTIETKRQFMKLSGRLREAYNICCHSRGISDEEIQKTVFYLAVRSYVYKETNPGAPDTERMNKAIEEKAQRALKCTGVESVLKVENSIDIFSDEFIGALEGIKRPLTRIEVFFKRLRYAISVAGGGNKTISSKYSKRLDALVARYNDRDSGMSRSDIESFIKEGKKIRKDLKEEEQSFKNMGLSLEEKAYYDILVTLRDDRGKKYPDSECRSLAPKIEELVNRNSGYFGWRSRDDIKGDFNFGLRKLLRDNNYPLYKDEEVFEKLWAQAESYTHSGGSY